MNYIHSDFLQILYSSKILHISTYIKYINRYQHIFYWMNLISLMWYCWQFLTYKLSLKKLSFKIMAWCHIIYLFNAAQHSDTHNIPTIGAFFQLFKKFLWTFCWYKEVDFFYAFTYAMFCQTNNIRIGYIDSIIFKHELPKLIYS